MSVARPVEWFLVCHLCHEGHRDWGSRLTPMWVSPILPQKHCNLYCKHFSGMQLVRASYVPKRKLPYPTCAGLFMGAGWHRWNSNPSKGPFIKRMAIHLGHFTVISLAENVTTLNSVLPLCQGGHNAQCLKSITILAGVNDPGTTLKGTRGSAMVELSNRETFEPRNRLSKAEMVVACSPVVLRHLWRAVSNHVGCTRCIRWSWERTGWSVVGPREKRNKNPNETL